MLKTRKLIINFDVRSLVVLGLVLMQLSVLVEAAHGVHGKYLFLGFGALSIGLGIFFVVLKLGLTKEMARSLIIFVLLFFPLEIIIALRQPDQQSGVMIIFRFICYALIATGYMLGRVRFEKTKSSEFIYNIVIPISVLLAGLIYFKSLNSVAYFARGRITAGDDISSVGLSFSMCLLGAICLSQAITRAGLFSKALHLLAAMSVLPAVIISASRGGLLAYFVTAVLILGVHGYCNRRNHGNLLVYFIVAFITLALLSLLIVQNDLIREQFLNLMDRFFRLSGGDDQSTTARGMIVSHYFQYFWDFMFWGYPGYQGPYPHNLLLDLFIRFGLYGLAIAGFVYFRAFLVIVNLKKIVCDPVLALISAAVIFSFLNAQISMTSEFLRFFWFGLAYLVANYKKSKFSMSNSTVLS
uniref:O-antigen ligase family protein n=1 Tax=Microbulbifer agarilyticus TaxID=260552 RepID=UPI0002557F41|nr:O-antigen ligase family protein [Microbulbifer agarilyticus]